MGDNGNIYVDGDGRSVMQRRGTHPDNTHAARYHPQTGEFEWVGKETEKR